MKLRILRTVANGDDKTIHLDQLQCKSQDGTWFDVPVVHAEDVLQTEADERLAHRLAVTHSVTPAVAMAIIEAARDGAEV